MKQYYYKLEDREFEKISEKELLQKIESGELTSETLIRNEEMNIWVKVSSINGLLPISENNNSDDVPKHIGSYILGFFLFIFWLLSGAAPQVAFLFLGFFLIMHYIDFPRIKRYF